MLSRASARACRFPPQQRSRSKEWFLLRKRRTASRGPVGEGPGYSARGPRMEPVIRVQALYFRNDPIVAGAPPMKPPVLTFGIPIGAATIWNYLERADVSTGQ